MSSTATKEPSLASNAASKKKGSKKKKNGAKAKSALPVADSSDGPQPGLGTEETEDSSPTPPEATDPSSTTPSHEITSNGHIVAPLDHAQASKPTGDETSPVTSDPGAKLEAMGQEREALRVEVERLRKQLEGIQTAHQQEASRLQTELEEANSAKESAQEQYRVLLGRVEKIKESLSDRLKRDKAELEEARERIDELEAQNEELRGSAETSGGDFQKLREELQDATHELTTLRSRNNLSAHNWHKEKEELTRTVQHLKKEMETTTNAMGEWEVLAMEERSVREALTDRVADLEEQRTTWQQSYEAVVAERESQATLIDNLQNALQEIQEARKKELRDLVEATDAQLQAQKRLVADTEARSSAAEAARLELSKEVERTAPFEREVREKSLLICKLRHEAIVLNDHLTKALRYLKRAKPEENVDRQVITNHLLHFLTLDRSDAKRFQVLQVMAGYLKWSDEERERAGLARPGASTGSLRLPVSPFHRTPSSPSLHGELFTDRASARDREKESLAELWAGFLERSAQEGAGAGEASVSASRKASFSSAATGSVRPTPGAGAQE